VEARLADVPAGQSQPLPVEILKWCALYAGRMNVHRSRDRIRK
jgi:hypothetical protein